MIEVLALVLASGLVLLVGYMMYRSYNPPKCRDKTLDDFKAGEIVEYVYSRPELRKAVLKRLEKEARDIVGKTILISLQQALELPNQLFIFIIIALGGAGVGFFIAMLINTFLGR